MTAIEGGSSAKDLIAPFAGLQIGWYPDAEIAVDIDAEAELKKKREKKVHGASVHEANIIVRCNQHFGKETETLM